MRHEGIRSLPGGRYFKDFRGDSGDQGVDPDPSLVHGKAHEASISDEDVLLEVEKDLSYSARLLQLLCENAGLHYERKLSESKKRLPPPPPLVKK